MSTLESNKTNQFSDMTHNYYSSKAAEFVKGGNFITGERLGNHAIPVYQYRRFPLSLSLFFSQPKAVIRPYPPGLDIEVFSKLQTELTDILRQQGVLLLPQLPVAIPAGNFICQHFLPDVVPFIPKQRYQYQFPDEIVERSRLTDFQMGVSKNVSKFFGDINGTTPPSDISLYRCFLYPDTPILFNPFSHLISSA
ncbi:hypothetical protein COY14_02255 [Candidatus Roizmanbacteria bacterium CG_4_10_14_0_2_um_filter_36_9]|uniref:Uncharacterized protein n=1 Tax=Candidatus Roizmanbacteria bacterium CG_4_10_14_0_2_um_filter_36_9 TaxID=1974823 RepID=A0A2M7U4B5_9BACT|nr:MAG: hypothetical protein COY14_02255 [Candidatus Roizmanbacteria bacterium CG_4_10_14_0_2_um_filter_36_9]